MIVKLMGTNEMDITVIVVTNVVLMSLFVYASYRVYKELKKRDRVIRELQNDLSALCAGATGVSGHLNRVDRQVKRMIERQDKVEIQDPENRAYHQAIRLIRNGAGIDELMTICGLVRSEAELLIMLHKGGRGGADTYHSAA